MFTLSGTRQSPIVIARVFLIKKHFLDLPTFQLLNEGGPKKYILLKQRLLRIIYHKDEMYVQVLARF